MLSKYPGDGYCGWSFLVPCIIFRWFGHVISRDVYIHLIPIIPKDPVIESSLDLFFIKFIHEYLDNIQTDLPFSLLNLNEMHLLLQEGKVLL